MKNLEEKVCTILDESLSYPEKVPFNPPESYPEYPFKDSLDASNKVYPAIRKALRLMNLDIKKYGTPNWSPLSEVVHKGDTVLIKPNLVHDRNLSGDSIFSVITHASLIRTAIDYAYKATGDGGKIVVADAPQHDANFKRIIEVTGLKEMVEHLRSDLSIPIELYDLRKEQVVYKNGVIVERRALPGDPKGYINVDLGRESKLAEIDSDFEKFYGTDYDRRKTTLFHNKSHHIYIVSRTVLESDVIINLPKLKTHMKAGITISLKNMIGTIGEKNSIVHYRIGSPSRGGDEFPEHTSMFNVFLLKFNRVYSNLFLSRGLGVNLYRMLIKLGRAESRLRSEWGKSNLAHSGNWCGNDTIWRTVLDISKIVLYASKNGQIHKTPQRRTLILVDGVIGGEGQGPLAPQAKRCGTIICGTNPWYVDRVGARLMGFDEQAIPLLSKTARNFSSNDISVSLLESDNVKMVNFYDFPNLHFKPPKTWCNLVSK